MRRLDDDLARLGDARGGARPGWSCRPPPCSPCGGPGRWRRRRPGPVLIPIRMRNSTPCVRLHVLGERLEPVLDRERRAERALGVVLVRDRRAEERHHPVAEELVDRPLVAVDRAQDHLEGAVHDRVDVLGVELLGHRGEARHVREHHGDDLALALDGALGGEDLLGEVLGGVGLRGREAAGTAERGRRLPARRRGRRARRAADRTRYRTCWSEG